MNQNPYDIDLPKTEANFIPLSPISLLRRTATVYPKRKAVVYGSLRRSWYEVWQRCVRMAASLKQLDIGSGDTVAIIAPNVPALLEAHFAIPMSGAVVNAINTRLDAKTIAFQLQHAEARIFMVHPDFAEVARDALSQLSSPPKVVEIEDPQIESPNLSQLRYEHLTEKGDATITDFLPEDEWQAISLNYTSGTTGDPKGVVYHHRGAYLNAISNALSWNIGPHPVYLWTLPMFHCNGWCFPWTITALAGTHICLRKMTAEAVFELIATHDVTHFCGAPIVLNMLLNEADKQVNKPQHIVQVATGGAPPPESVISGMRKLGMNVTHLYGLTETYGPSTVCAWHDEWDNQPISEQARLMSRQGVNTFMIENYCVADPKTCQTLPKDGNSMGEILLRGNTIMKGYLKNKQATKTAFSGGWFHSSDLAVWHDDGYLQIKDRVKDIVISGGENISTVEIENVLYGHPNILEAAVVAKPDDHWGEIPCAFVTLKEEGVTSEKEIMEYCRQRMAHFKTPKTIVFGALPKTATGKIQKFVLREKAKALGL